jgi:hypothetical protein
MLDSIGIGIYAGVEELRCGVYSGTKVGCLWDRRKWGVGYRASQGLGRVILSYHYHVSGFSLLSCAVSERDLSVRFFVQRLFVWCHVQDLGSDTVGNRVSRLVIARNKS